MPKNTLYNFLEHCVYKNKKLHMGNDVYLIKAQDKTKHPYFRFDLPIKHPISFKLNELELNLAKHHISVYKGETSANPSLSQFHYSGYFRDKNNQEYVLHVYFNDRNQLTQSPILAKVINNDEKTSIEIEEELSDQLITLAKEKVDPIISEMQRRKSEKIKQLKNQYEKDERLASELSADLKAKKSEYNSIVQRMIKVLKELNPLFKHDSYIKIAKWLESTPQLPQASNHAQTKHSVPETKEAEPPKQKREPTRHKTTKRPSKSKVKTSSNFEADLLEAIAKFNILEKDDIKAASEICDLYAYVNSISLLSDNNTELPKGFIANVNKLQLQIDHRGTYLLLSLLTQRQFESAKTLSPFHYKLDEKLIVQALEQADAELLDFLLSYGEYTLDNQPIRIDGQTYKSAVHYCFSTCQKKSMAPCLSVLIRHGASILVKGTNDLPIAHTILSTPKHPLLPALEENKSSTLQSRYFYTQLANLMQNFLDTHDVDEERKKALTKHIESYRNTATSLILSRELDNGRGKALREQIGQFEQEIKHRSGVENLLEEEGFQQAINSLFSEALRSSKKASHTRRINRIFKEATKFVQDGKVDTWDSEKNEELTKLFGIKPS
ncbi:coiled-coil-containing protein [Legionella lansingensis]|uniref:Coiled-coil-containing protein n=1 Tax=Legionella lansingensis TaxID=45067 RepID=A0A0W0VPP7_9GAMM|nr:hypothetical protein [Legionella lansingensis]KTD22107.1 coiled-coil-containing protein [Legionella lansingensis]SNV45744.1 coiled-coil-containing protein [Legionella lansingensis]